MVCGSSVTGTPTDAVKERLLLALAGTSVPVHGVVVVTLLSPGPDHPHHPGGQRSDPAAAGAFGHAAAPKEPSAGPKKPGDGLREHQ